MAQFSYQMASIVTIYLGVRAKIDLSEGLTLAENPTAPDGTTFNPSTGIWDIGMLEPGDSNIRDIQIKVVLASPSLTDLPLEKRCLMAEVISAVPWFASDLQKRVNDRAIACLGKGTEVELRGDEIELFRHHDCVDTVTYPCTSEPAMELFVFPPTFQCPDQAHMGKESHAGSGIGA